MNYLRGSEIKFVLHYSFSLSAVLTPQSRLSLFNTRTLFLLSNSPTPSAALSVLSAFTQAAQWAALPCVVWGGWGSELYPWQSELM